MRSHNNRPYLGKPSHAHYNPIQVTLYATSAYARSGFQPIYVVIADGEYIEIPARDRKGRSRRLFAHYAQGNLHFDTNHNCQRIQGSSGYQYDSRWDKGYGYTHINAGNDYDFTGLRLQIRSMPATKQQTVQKTTEKQLPRYDKAVKKTNKQAVKKQPVRSYIKHTESRDVTKVVKTKSVKSIDYRKPPQEMSRSKVQVVKGSSVQTDHAKIMKKTTPPSIVQAVARQDHRGLDAKAPGKHESEERSHQVSNKNPHATKKPSLVEHKTNTAKSQSTAACKFRQV